MTTIKKMVPQLTAKNLRHTMLVPTQYHQPLSDDQFSQLIEATPFASGTGREVYSLPSDDTVVVKKIKGAFLSNS
jgi:hypothetical protein